MRRTAVVTILTATFTCLADGLGPATAVASAPVQDEAKTAPLPTAKEVVAMMIKAQGGEEALAKHPTASMTGKFSMPAMGMGGPMSIKTSKGSMRIEIDITGFGKSLQGYTDGVAWSIDPASGAQLLEGSMLESMKRQANSRGDLDLFKMWDSVKVTGRERFADTDCVLLELKSGKDREVRLIDEKTGRMVASRTVQSSPMGEIPIVTTIEAWKDFDGLNVPVRMSMAMMGQKQVIEVDKMDFAEIPPAEFALPPAIKALVADKKARAAESKTVTDSDSSSSSDSASSSDSSSSKDSSSSSDSSSSKDSSSSSDSSSSKSGSSKSGSSKSGSSKSGSSKSGSSRSGGGE